MRYLTVLFFIVLSIQLSGQNQFVWNVQEYSLSFDFWSDFTVVNSDQKHEVGIIQIEIKKRRGTAEAMVIESDQVILPEGQSVVRIRPNMRIVSYGTGFESQFAQKFNRLPNGQYHICARYISYTRGVTKIIDCSESAIQVNLTMPELLFPFDGSVLETNYPTYTWTPVIPGSLTEITYEVSVVQISDHQNKYEAISRNIPLIHDRTQRQALLHPRHLTGIEQNKSYAWRVKTFFRGTLLDETEVWTFSMQAHAGKEQLANQSYLTIENINKLKNKVRVLDDTLRLKLTNHHLKPTLKFKIKEISTGTLITGNHPNERSSQGTINLKSGTNKLDIALDEYGLQQNTSYVLLIENHSNITPIPFQYERY